MPLEPARLMSVGLSHRSAPVDVRERIALDEKGVRRHLELLRDEQVCDEAFIVSTCNRVELYAVPHEGAVGQVKGWLDQFHGPRGEPIDRYLVWRNGKEAVSHLFRVAASLDSLVVGEPQILGQVKDAIRVADEAGSLGRVLGRLTRQALSVAKRVRSETAIGRFRVGIGNAGVDLATQIFGDLSGRKALLVGVGEMGQQVAKALKQAGLEQLWIANRTYERAVELAGTLAATPVAMTAVDELLGKVDVVIAASGATEPIIGVDAVRRAIRARRYDPLFLVDLAVPRNIDPAVGGIDEAYLFNVDDLTQVLERGQQARQQAADEAQRIIDDETEKFLSSLREIDVGPHLGRITRWAEDLRAQELARSKRLVDGLHPEQLEQLDSMSRALVKKLLDGSLRAIRDAAREGDDERLAALLAPWEDE